MYTYSTGHASFDVEERVRQTAITLDFLARTVPGATRLEGLDEHLAAAGVAAPARVSGPREIDDSEADRSVLRGGRQPDFGCLTGDSRAAGRPASRRSVEREVVGALVRARPLLLELHQHVVEQR